MECPNCNNNISDNQTICEFCGTHLAFDSTIEQNENISYDVKQVQVKSKTVSLIIKIFIISIFVPLFLFAIAFIGFGSYSYINEHNITKGYNEAIGTLTDYKNCSDETCEGVYKYNVNHTSYTLITSNQKISKNLFKNKEIVYYNPSNPNESIIYAGWSSLIIIGLVIIVVQIIIFIIASILIKKFIKSKDEITMYIKKPLKKKKYLIF